MNRCNTLLWRKIRLNPVLDESWRKFSRLEAWLYIINVLASRKDDESSGLKRGEFSVSLRYFAKCFDWSHGRTQRFIDLLLEKSMIWQVVRRLGKTIETEGVMQTVATLTPVRERFRPGKQGGAIQNCLDQAKACELAVKDYA